MSHELRTPMTAIIGYSELLIEDAEDRGDENLSADLKKIYSAGKHLLEIINAVLDVSKIEAGKMEIYIEAFSVDEVVENVVQIVKPLIQKNNNRLLLDSAGMIGLIESDRTKLRQGLFNLISNASKFTENGQITLTVSRYLRDQKEWISFAVSDTGIGMTPDQLEKLFCAFSQANATVSSKYGGTGLGLYITNRFCDLLGGNVSVQSEYGKGTTFTIHLPTARAEGSVREQPIEGPLSLNGPRVLVIDDDPAVHDIIKRSLSSRGMQVLTASNAEAGLNLAKKYTPEVIILDVVMKGVDGWHALGRLKSDPELYAIPVVMLSILDNKNAGYALGASEYICKPIDRERLEAVILRCCPQLDQRQATGSALVIDDDRDGRRFLRRMLEDSGWEVREAEDGLRALLCIADDVPNLIILDLMMPGMDGFTFLDEVRKNPATAAIPVIVVTAKDLTGEEREHLAGKALRVLEKCSYPREELLSRVGQQVDMFLNLGRMKEQDGKDTFSRRQRNEPGPDRSSTSWERS